MSVSEEADNTTEIAAELLVDDRARAQEVEVIPESPADAYRLGVEHGRKAALGNADDGACWACGRSRVMPDHESQVRMLAELHYARSDAWHWLPAEFDAVRVILDEHGPDAYLSAIIDGHPMYGTLRVVLTNRSVLDVPRSELMQRAREMRRDRK